MRSRLPVLFLILSLAAPAIAQVRIPVQGRLLDAGAPVDGAVDMDITFEDQFGTPLTCERFSSVVMSPEGVFAVLVGDTVNACDDGLPTAIDETTFATRTTVRVDVQGETFRFPVGDVPSAVRANTAANAERLGGVTLDEVLGDPRIFNVPAGQSLQDALDLAGTFPEAVVIAGPGSHFGDLVVPTGVSLRGYSTTQTIIEGKITVPARATLEDLRIAGALGAASVEVVGAGDATFLRNLFVRSTSTTTAGILLSGEQRTVIQGTVINIQSEATSLVGLDVRGGHVSVNDLRIRSVSNTGNGIGVRIANVTAPDSAEDTTAFDGLVIEVDQSTGTSTAMIFDRPDNLIIVDNARTRSDIGLDVNQGTVLYKNSIQVLAATSIDVEAVAAIRVYNTELFNFPGGAGTFICNNTYQAGQTTPLNSTCQ